MWVWIRSHLWCQWNPECDFLLKIENGYANHKGLPKRLPSSPQHQKNPKFLTQELPARLYMQLSQTRLTTATVWWMDYHKKVQLVQNTASRLVFNLRKYDRITPALVTLQKLLIIFKGLHGKALNYIQRMITPLKSRRCSMMHVSWRFQNSRRYFRQVCIRSVGASGV